MDPGGNSARGGASSSFGREPVLAGSPARIKWIVLNYNLATASKKSPWQTWCRPWGKTEIRLFFFSRALPRAALEIKLARVGVPLSVCPGKLSRPALREKLLPAHITCVVAKLQMLHRLLLLSMLRYFVLESFTYEGRNKERKICEEKAEGRSRGMGRKKNGWCTTWYKIYH